MRSSEAGNRVERLAAELGVSFSVAADIDYLRSLEVAVVAAAKANPSVKDFAVHNRALEVQLEGLGADL